MRECFDSAVVSFPRFLFGFEGTLHENESFLSVPSCENVMAETAFSVFKTTRTMEFVESQSHHTFSAWSFSLFAFKSEENRNRTYDVTGTLKSFYNLIHFVHQLFVPEQLHSQ